MLLILLCQQALDLFRVRSQFFFTIFLVVVSLLVQILNLCYIALGLCCSCATPGLAWNEDCALYYIQFKAFSVLLQVFPMHSQLRDELRTFPDSQVELEILFFSNLFYQIPLHFLSCKGRLVLISGQRDQVSLGVLGVCGYLSMIMVHCQVSIIREKREKILVKHTHLSSFLQISLSFPNLIFLDYSTYFLITFCILSRDFSCNQLVSQAIIFAGSRNFYKHYF